MVAPAYVDISHFRAPYENAYFSGLGQDKGIVEPGAPPPPPPPPEVPPPPPEGPPPTPGGPPPAPGAVIPTLAEVVVTGPDGIRRITPEFQPSLDYILGFYFITMKGNLGHLTPIPVEQIKLLAKDPKFTALFPNMAAAWIKDMASRGFLLYISDSTLEKLIQSGPGTPLAPEPDYIAFFAADDPQVTEDFLALMAGSIQLAGPPTKKVEPEPKGLLATIGPVGVAAIVVVAVGGLYYLARGKTAAPPRIS